MTLTLIQNHRPIAHDAWPAAWMRAVWQWHIVWLVVCAAGFEAMADTASRQLDKRGQP